MHEMGSRQSTVGVPGPDTPELIVLRSLINKLWSVVNVLRAQSPEPSPGYGKHGRVTDPVW